MKHLQLYKATRAIAFLELLEKGPARRPPGSPAGAACRRRGWTDYLVRDLSTGELVTLEEIKRRVPPETHLSTMVDYGENLEVLTDAGRDILAQWRSGVRSIRLA